MALFEHVIILKQSLSSNELSNELKNHTDMVSELSGNVVYQESWGMRNLAYPIKNNRFFWWRQYHFWVGFCADITGPWHWARYCG